MKYKLYKGDCLEVMDKLIEGKIIFHIIITDPPYNISRDNTIDILTLTFPFLIVI